MPGGGEFDIRIDLNYFALIVLDILNASPLRCLGNRAAIFNRLRHKMITETQHKYKPLAD
jgi:hypothetical protein